MVSRVIKSQASRFFVISSVGICVFAIHWSRQILLTFRP